MVGFCWLDESVASARQRACASGRSRSACTSVKERRRACVYTGGRCAIDATRTIERNEFVSTVLRKNATGWRRGKIGLAVSEPDTETSIRVFEQCSRLKRIVFDNSFDYNNYMIFFLVSFLFFFRRNFEILLYNNLNCTLEIVIRKRCY